MSESKRSAGSSRRQFLKGAAAAGAALALNRYLPGETALAQTQTTLALWHGWAGSDNTTALNSVLAGFNSSNKDNIKIQPTAFQWDDLFSKWVVSAASGRSPDVVIIHVSEIPEFAKKGLLLPIGDQIKQSGIDTSKMPPAVVKAADYGGQTYAVPGDIHPLGLYYNVDMVRAAGLNPDAPPKTGAEFLTWAQKLTKTAGGKTTQYGIDLPVNGAIPRWVWYSLLYQFGGTFLDASGKSAVNSPAGVQALQYLVDLNNKYKVSTKSNGNLSGNDPFASRLAAMRIIGPWEVNQRMSQKINFRTAPIPTIGQTPAAWGNAHCLSIPKQRSADHTAQGMKFIKWFAQNYAKPAITVGIIPVDPVAQKSQEFTTSKQYPYYRAFVDTLPHVVFEPSLPQYTQIFSFAKPTPLSTNLEAALSGSKSVKQALDDMKAGIDAQLV
ncbi:ABC transporter substrate-binding protein [Deinococcus sp.]|uniref:ABC transporter substrate-binding protein n=1 Tax=Deinococcus sp. TaxID=47478 RepID=UPI003CC69031